MFSEALRILDRNTAELMVDRMKDEMDAVSYTHLTLPTIRLV